MPQFVERQNKNRALGGQNKNNGKHIPFIPYRTDPRLSAADFFVRKNDWGLSYTRKQAIQKYHVLIKTKHSPKAILNSFSQATFPNKYQSIVYHLKKHGQGMKPGEYAESALAFFIENYYAAQLKKDRLGKQAWNIKGQTGGWWTKLGGIITYWF